MYIEIDSFSSQKGGAMKIQSIYPVICTKNLNESKQFYTSHFYFEVTFEADWYVSLRSTQSPAYELAFLDFTHPSLPEGFRQSAQGMLLNFEVSNVDDEYDRLTAAGLPIILALKSEDWGQRHFITKDPNGVLVDVIQPTDPSESFESQYK